MQMELPCSVRTSPLLVDKPRTLFNLIDVPQGFSSVETPTRVEQPIAVASEQTAKPRDRIFEREEILQRVADFKANQHRFQRKREEYYKETMAKVR
jgi:hypothetical protein